MTTKIVEIERKNIISGEMHYMGHEKQERLY